jgi:hypothetical protein
MQALLGGDDPREWDNNEPGVRIDVDVIFSGQVLIVWNTILINNVEPGRFTKLPMPSSLYSIGAASGNAGSASTI